MTDISTCPTCHWHRNLYLHTVSRHDHRCFRPQSFKALSKNYVGENGSSCLRERDNYPEPQRVDGDKCGIEGKHWKMREAV